MGSRLHHVPPDSIQEDQHHFYVTQCVLPRNKPVLLDCAGNLVEAIHHYHKTNRWFCMAYVIMPDHVHLLLTPYPRTSLSKLMQQWKGYTAKTFGIKWQRNFFEHRLRNDESTKNKAAYMELNPLRKGLVQSSEKWPWFGYCH
jgi:putative transposase